MKRSRHLPLLLALPLLCSAAAPTEEAFTAEMLRRLTASMPGVTLTAKTDDPLVIEVVGGSWSEGKINLHRLFGFCRQASASDCEGEKRTFVENIAAKPPEITASALRIVVRDDEYIDYLRSVTPAGEPPDALAIAEPIGDELFALLAADSPTATTIVGSKTLKDLRLTREQAWTLAMKQTKASLPPLPKADQIKAGVAFQDVDYLASMLLDRDGWKALSEQVGPELFVTVASDRFVFVGWMPDGPNIEKFKQVVREDCAAAPRCVSPHIYRFRDGQWRASP